MVDNAPYTQRRAPGHRAISPSASPLPGLAIRLFSNAVRSTIRVDSPSNREGFETRQFRHQLLSSVLRALGGLKLFLSATTPPPTLIAKVAFFGATRKIMATVAISKVVF